MQISFSQISEVRNFFGVIRKIGKIEKIPKKNRIKIAFVTMRLDNRRAQVREGWVKALHYGKFTYF